MAFPENLTTRTVVGTFLTPRGVPASGYIIFSPQVALHNEDTDEIVLPSPVKKNLDSTGSFSVELLDTENLDLAPSGWGYKVSYHISGVTKNEFITIIPAGEGSIQFSDLVEIDPLELSLTVIQEILDRLDEVETGKSNIDHTHTHTDVTDLGTAALVDTGTGATNVILGNDARLTDARTPNAHAASHVSAGSDPLTIDQSQVTDLTTDLSSKVEKTTLNANSVLYAVTDDTPAALAVGASTVVGRKATGDVVAMTATEAKNVLAITNTDVSGLGTAAVTNTGTGATNTILGNDARLTDARTPIAHTHPQSDITNLTTDLGNKADLVEGIIPTSQIPSLAINDTFVAANQAAMLALTAQVGDIAIRSDINRTFVLQTAPASTLANWIMLSGGSDVVSVNGQTGIITLGYSDVGADVAGAAASAQSAAQSYAAALVDDLSGVTNASAARTALGLGTAAVANTGTGASNVILGNDSRLTDTRTPSAASIVDAMIATTLSPSKITGTAAILGANTFTADQTIGTGAAASDIILTLDGGSNSGHGPAITFKRGGTANGYLGTDSIINGGTSSGLTLYGVTSPVKIQLGSNVLASFATTGNTFTSTSATGVPAIIKGFASQSASLTEWQDSASTTLASVSAAGLGSFDSLKIIGSSTNTGVGYLSHTSTSGTYNTALGYLAQRFISTGSYNTALGAQSNYNNTGGTSVTAVGYGAAQGVAANSHTGGTYLGYLAGNGVTTGGYNIALGYYAGAYSTNQSYELFINSINRVDRAGDIAGSLIYGVQSATVSAQTLTMNASVTAEYGLRIGTNSGSLKLGTSGGLYDRKAITNTYWGYSASYRAIMLGSASTNYNVTDGATTLAINYDPSINASASFSGDGREMIVRRGLTVMVPDVGNTLYKRAMTWRDGFVGINQTAPTGGLQVQPPDAASVGARVLGFTAQSANLQTWEDSASTVLASVSAAGLGTFAGVTSTENVAVTKSQSATTRIAVTNGSTNANALAEIRAATDAGYTGLFKHPAAYGGYKILGASDAAIYNSSAGHMSFLNDAAGVIRFATNGASTAQVQIGTTGLLNAYYGLFVDGSTDVTQLRVQGVAGQSQPPITVENSSGGVLASVSAAGAGTFAGVTSTTGTFSSDVSVGAGSAAVDSLLTINGGTNTGKGGAIAFKRGGSSKGYLGTRSFVIGGSTDDISLISYADLTLGIGSMILMAMSSSANTLNAYSSTAIPVVAKGFSAQTANLQEWQNSSATVLASISAAGLGTFTGLSSGASVTITATNGSFVSQGASGQWTGLDLKTGTSNRWKINRNGTSESGSNAGSNLDFYAYMDDGTTSITPLSIERATGVATFLNQVKVGASTTTRASLNIPAGTAPTTPVNGDIWQDGTDLKIHIGGVTKTVTLT